MTDKSKLSTESYKGVRDFYPEELFVQHYIFNTWRKAVEKFGYIEYDASVLEPAELYRAKSGEEIVNEQTYTFTDKGDREVTLRPEMTPTVARMIAAKEKELAFPVRWFSIPNLFRYEKPQRGRLREHWQLNVDMFGAEGVDADVEIITVAYNIMKEFGARDGDFQILVNDRVLLNEKFGKKELIKLLDRKNKMPKEEFEKLWQEIDGKPFDANIEANETIKNIISTLNQNGISNVVFEPTITRGFDYYTGVVFEIFDTNPENSRALFGGGRYDDLTSLFGGRQITGIGFGMGDVTIRDFLETRGLLPAYKSTTELAINIMDEGCALEAQKLADTLRKSGVNIVLSLNSKKPSKQKTQFVTLIGQNEVNSQEYEIKNFLTGEKVKLPAHKIPEFIKQNA